jgi:hypothetical protein
MNELKNFDSLIRNTELLLIDGQNEVIEWEPEMNKEYWEKNSFLHSRKMKTPMSFWQKNKWEIYTIEDLCRIEIRRLVVNRENETAKDYFSKELENILKKFESFRIEHKMNNHKVLVQNPWFFECYQMLLNLNKWYEDLIPSELKQTPQPIVESPFSVLEWATIFYYADETKLLSESRLIKTRLEQFMSKHQINTTPVNFKNSYYEAKRRINKKNDYPINKLELIIPFLKENYKQTVTKVENDIIFLEENKPEY